MGVGVPDVVHSTSSSSVVEVVHFSIFRSVEKHYIIYLFVLNMFRGHHLQLRCHPPLFNNIKWFNIKFTVAQHPVIQKEVDELFAMCGIESWTSIAGFYSDVFVAPKCIDGL